MKVTQSLSRISPALVLAGGMMLSATQAHAQAAHPVLKLTSGTTVCNFQTNSDGVKIIGNVPGVIKATGTFGVGCNIGGSVTGQALANITASPSTIAVGNSSTIAWQGVGDVCHYAGSNPAVTGWPNGGIACLGVSECATGGSFHHLFANGGGTQYNFSLKCDTGANANDPNGSTDTKTAVVTVTGGTPPTSCLNTANLSRQTTGTISTSTGTYSRNDTDYKYWSNSMGWNYIPGPGDVGYQDHYEWPGMTSNDLKYYIPDGKYIAVAFHVDDDFPYHNGITGPYGIIGTNKTNSEIGARIVSISEECGDFTQPPASDPDSSCYAEFSQMQGQLWWRVPGPQVPHAAGWCELKRDKTYYLNIVYAALGTPEVSTCNAPSGTCRINISNGLSAGAPYDKCTAAYGTCLPEED